MLIFSGITSKQQPLLVAFALTALGSTACSSVVKWEGAGWDSTGPRPWGSFGPGSCCPCALPLPAVQSTICVLVLLLLFAGSPIQLTLATDQRPLQQNLNASLLDLEGATYHFWWKQAYNFARAASCAAETEARQLTMGPITRANPAEQWLMPQGWSVHSVVWTQANREVAPRQVHLPLAALLRSEDTLALVVRSTLTYNDWMTGEHAGLPALAATPLHTLCMWLHCRAALHHTALPGRAD